MSDAVFFERVQFEALRHALPDYLKSVALFAYITGWRIPSEVLKLHWANVDFLGRQVRLDPGTTTRWGATVSVYCGNWSLVGSTAQKETQGCYLPMGVPS